MANLALLPITELKEVKAFLQQIPVTVDHGHFSEFVLGFPHKYLAATPAAEVLKHYKLMECLRDKAVISSLSREGPLSRLCLVARDRRALFCRIAGVLSSFGLDIIGAEAFANANSLVLDTFAFADTQNSFVDGPGRQFQVALEDAVEGKSDVAAQLTERLTPVRLALQREPLDVTVDPEAHPEATAVIVRGPDHFGLLYLISRTFAEGEYNIEMAYVETPENRVRDQFYLTRDGARLTPAMQEDVKERIGRLGQGDPS